MSRIKQSAVLTAAFVGLFVGAASAQETVVANVPFSFVVRGEQFPAGRYEIRRTGDGVVSIIGKDSRSAIVAIAIPAAGRDPLGERPSLVFTRAENVYRLSEIWEDGADGWELQRSDAGARIGRTLEPSASRYVLAANLK